MNAVFPFSEVARLPMPGDNVAIATRRLEAGTGIDCNGQPFALSHTVMEGHRFAVEPIDPGQFCCRGNCPLAWPSIPCSRATTPATRVCSTHWASGSWTSNCPRRPILSIALSRINWMRRIFSLELRSIRMRSGGPFSAMVALGDGAWARAIISSSWARPRARPVMHGCWPSAGADGRRRWRGADCPHRGRRLVRAQ